MGWFGGTLHAQKKTALRARAAFAVSGAADSGLDERIPSVAMPVGYGKAQLATRPDIPTDVAVLTRKFRTISVDRPGREPNGIGLPQRSTVPSSHEVTGQEHAE